MTVWSIIIILTVPSAGSVVMAQEKVSPVSVLLWECCNHHLESLVMTFTIITRPAEEYPDCTGSQLLVVHIESTAIWNCSVVGTKVVGPGLLSLTQAKEILAHLDGD